MPGARPLGWQKHGETPGCQHALLFKDRGRQRNSQLPRVDVMAEDEASRQDVLLDAPG